MNRVLKMVVFGVTGIILSASGVAAQTKEVTVNRMQLWLRAELKASVGNGWGILAREGSRYNLSYDKTVNGVTVDDNPEGYWLQEAWVGPFYKNRIGSVPFSVNLVYRPQWWYPDEEKADSYFRHTVSSAFVLNKPLKRLVLQYRLLLWGMLPVEEGSVDLDNEFMVRNLLGGIWKIDKNWQLTLSEEVYLKPTADEDDQDGSELFFRNAVWAGVDYLPVKDLRLSLKYVQFYTNKMHSSAKTTGVFDHYILVEFSKKLSLKK